MPIFSWNLLNLSVIFTIKSSINVNKIWQIKQPTLGDFVIKTHIKHEAWVIYDPDSWTYFISNHVITLGDQNISITLKYWLRKNNENKYSCTYSSESVGHKCLKCACAITLNNYFLFSRLPEKWNKLKETHRQNNI